MSNFKVNLYLKLIEFTGIDLELNWFEFDGGYCSGWVSNEI